MVFIDLKNCDVTKKNRIIEIYPETAEKPLPAPPGRGFNTNRTS